jgi:hypothetical protein
MGGSMADSDRGIYFYLVNLTSKGRLQEESEIHKDHQRVTTLILSLKGTCTLYSVPGPYDYISEVVGITADGALQVQREIEAAGFAKALLLPARKSDK